MVDGWVTDEFGHYECDKHKLMAAVRSTDVRIQQLTSRRACAIHMNPLDIKQFTSWLPDNARMDYVGRLRLYGIPVLASEDVRPGVAQLSQCPLPHPAPEDCVYHSRSQRQIGRPSGD